MAPDASLLMAATNCGRCLATQSIKPLAAGPISQLGNVHLPVAAASCMMTAAQVRP